MIFVINKLKKRILLLMKLNIDKKFIEIEYIMIFIVIIYFERDNEAIANGDCLDASQHFLEA